MGRQKLSSIQTPPHLTHSPSHLANSSSTHQGAVRQPRAAGEDEGVGSQAIEGQHVEQVHQHLRGRVAHT